MPKEIYSICILNPVEVFVESPRTQRFVRAINDMDGVSLCTIGIGEGNLESKRHLNLADGPKQRSICKAILRQVRIVLFLLVSLLRIHWLSEQLHSPNKQMRSNWLLRRSIRNFFESQKPDLVIARDIYSVPLVHKVLKKDYVWIDLPDFTAEMSSYQPHYKLILGPYFAYLTQHLRRVSDSFSTVSQSLADYFYCHFQLKPITIRNALPYYPPPARDSSNSPDISDLVTDSKVRLVYVGAAIRRREIELCIRAINLLPSNFFLDLFLVPVDHVYLEELQVLTSNSSRIRILAPIPHTELIIQISTYTAALVVIPDTSVNSSCSLPNKFFEALQARLPIITGPTPEIANLVRQYQIGTVAESFTEQDIANACRHLTVSGSWRYQNRLDIAARALSDNADLESIRQRAMSMLVKV